MKTQIIKIYIKCYPNNFVYVYTHTHTNSLIEKKSGVNK